MVARTRAGGGRGTWRPVRLNATARVAVFAICTMATLAVAVMLVNLTRYRRAADCDTPKADIDNCVLHERAMIAEGPSPRVISWCSTYGGCNSEDVYNATLRTAGGRTVQVVLDSQGNRLRQLEDVVLLSWDGRPIAVRGAGAEVAARGWSPAFARFSLVVATTLLPMSGVLALWVRRWPAPAKRTPLWWAIAGAELAVLGLVMVAVIGVIAAWAQMGLLAMPH